MQVLLTGASGFIGSHLAAALAARGHDVTCALRNPDRAPPGTRGVAADFARDTQAEHWLARVQGMDVVVNAVGIFREHGAQTFDRLHVQAPRALFQASAQARVGRVVQLSALGADEQAQTRYHASKREADDALLALPLDAVVVQPSLVFGLGGASARLFLGLAGLPWTPVPAGGHQRVQPVHVDDALACLVALVEGAPAPSSRIALVGPHPLTLREYLAALRRALGLGSGRFVTVPRPLVDIAARAGSRTGGLLDRDAWRMLERGNTADPAATRVLLKRDPRPPQAFIASHEREAALACARLAWGLPLLRASVALVWIVTGVLSLGIYPVQDSYALLAQAGVPAGLRPAALYGAAALDLALGVLSLVRPRRGLWLAQLAVMLGYTAVITLRLPEYWLHPYGPVLKNLPLIAALLVLAAFDRKR